MAHICNGFGGVVVIYCIRSGRRAIVACDGMGDRAFLDSDEICSAGGTKIISTSI